MNIRFLKKKYPGLSFSENFLGGHVSFLNTTIYGENAMKWAVNIRTKRWGVVCFRLPVRCFGQWFPLYFYVSPNATPQASTFYIGGEYPEERANSSVRRKAFGHNFNTDLLYKNPK